MGYDFGSCFGAVLVGKGLSSSSWLSSNDLIKLYFMPVEDGDEPRYLSMTKVTCLCDLCLRRLMK